MFMFYLAERIELPHTGPGVAGSSVAVADTAFDVMVFTLIQSRFGEMAQKETADIDIEYVSSKDEFDADPVPKETGSSSTGAIVGDAALLGFAVATGLLVLLSVAAKPLGMNDGTQAPRFVRLLLLAGVGALAVAWVAGHLCLRAWRARAGDDQWPDPRVERADPPRGFWSEPTRHHLDLPKWFWVIPTIGAAAWIAVIFFLTGGPAHVPLLAGVVAVVMFALHTNSLLQTPIRLQTLEPRLSEVAFAVLAGAAVAVASFWFVSYGMWQGSDPVPGGWLTATAFVVFVGNVLVFLGAGHALAWGLPRGRQSEHFLCRGNVRGYVGLDAICFGIVFVIGVVIPLYAASRDSELHASSLSVVASMVFLPGLISAVVWGSGTWKTYSEEMARARKQGRLVRTIVPRAGMCWSRAMAREDERIQRLQQHLRFQREGVLGLTAVGLVYLAFVLVG